MLGVLIVALGFLLSPDALKLNLQPDVLLDVSGSEGVLGRDNDGLGVEDSGPIVGVGDVPLARDRGLGHLERRADRGLGAHDLLAEDDADDLPKARGLRGERRRRRDRDREIRERQREVVLGVVDALGLGGKSAEEVVEVHSVCQLLWGVLAVSVDVAHCEQWFNGKGGRLALGEGRPWFERTLRNQCNSIDCCLGT